MVSEYIDRVEAYEFSRRVANEEFIKWKLKNPDFPISIEVVQKMVDMLNINIDIAMKEDTVSEDLSISVSILMHCIEQVLAGKCVHE